MSNQAVVERIYILDGGVARVEDGSIYSPGLNVGIPMALSCNAYLIQHKGEWLIWDTGTPDEIIFEPEGKIIAHGIRGIVTRTLSSQLEEINVRPDQISTIIFSHAHYDHVGNCRLFEKAKWIVQKAEYEAMFGSNPGQYGYLPEMYASMLGNNVNIVEGDYDIFGDGAVQIISTPGHTLGHCSLLVRLPVTGVVLLSGDVAHNSGNLQHHRVPSFNADQDASVSSMKKVEALTLQESAKIWINHDTLQSETLAHAPAWIR